MAEQPLHLRSDGDLEVALRAFGESVAWPAAPVAADGADLAAMVRARIQASPRTAKPARTRWNWWPARRALVAAVLVLLAFAAIAGAVGLGLPRLRLILGPAPVSPPPSLAPSRSPAAGVPGSTLGLGRAVDLSDLDQQAGFAVTWPDDPAIGPPDVAYIDPSLGGQVGLVWRSRDGLPDTLEPGVGQILTAFRGTVDNGFYNKAVSTDTTVQLASVDGDRAYWVSGGPHFLFYEGPDGNVHDPRRWIGDALLWADGPITYRLETALGKETAVRLAESMP